MVENVIKQLNDLVKSLSRAKEDVRKIARELKEALLEEKKALLAPKVEGVPEKPIYALDGGYRSFSAFVNDLVIIRIASVKVTVSDRVRLVLLKRDYRMHYGYDMNISGDSLMMLSLETDEALKLSALDGFLLLDGPIINPPIEFREPVEREIPGYYAKREGLLKEHVIGIIKRHRRALLRDYAISKGIAVGGHKESILLIELLGELRKELGKVLEPIVIGPFEYNREGIKTYARYVQRTLAHKPVIVESVKEEFPLRLLDERVRPPSSRSRSPMPIEAAHMFARIDEQTAKNFSSIVYRLLRMVE